MQKGEKFWQTLISNSALPSLNHDSAKLFYFTKSGFSSIKRVLGGLGTIRYRKCCGKHN
jgi:hypothetical protein